MYSTQRVKELLDSRKMFTADLAEHLYGSRSRSLTSILADDANPTARILEKIAEFFHVSIDSLFDKNEKPVALSEVEFLTRAVYKKELDAKDQEIEHLKTRIEDLLYTKGVMERENQLLRDRLPEAAAKEVEKEVKPKRKKAAKQDA